jgi:hypothetical protein
MLVKSFANMSHPIFVWFFGFHAVNHTIIGSHHGVVKTDMSFTKSPPILVLWWMLVIGSRVIA